jgi:protein phosphatase
MATTGVDAKNTVEHVGQTDLGLRRPTNQDHFAAVPAASEEMWRERGHVFIVADGMGGHAAGERASELAADIIPHTYQKLRDLPVSQALKEAVQEANKVIHQRGLANPDFQGMGTTTTALVLLPDRAMAAHVGDSRLYRLRGNQLQQLSFDHSVLWELSAAGHDASQFAPDNFLKNRITRSLGPKSEVDVDLEGPFPLQAGDTFLLCSDGLSGQVSDQELGKTLRCLPPEEAAPLLVNLANLRGGPDNITVVIARTLAHPHEGEGSPGGFEAEALGEGALPQRGPARGIHPLVFGVIAAAVLASVGLLYAGFHVVAAAVAAVGVVAGLASYFVLAQRAGPGETKGRLGRAPYGSWDCSPDRGFADELQKILQQLKDAAREKDWKVDWSNLENVERRAEAALARDDFEHAIADFGRAVTAVMSALRQQPAAG